MFLFLRLFLCISFAYSLVFYAKYTKMYKKKLSEQKNPVNGDFSVPKAFFLVTRISNDRLYVVTFQFLTTV